MPKIQITPSLSKGQQPKVNTYQTAQEAAQPKPFQGFMKQSNDPQFGNHGNKKKGK